MNPFLRSNAKRHALRAEATAVAGGQKATLRLYDPIDSWGGSWGISAKEFVAALDQLGDVSQIDLLINSPGGEVWDGLAILNALRSHPAHVTAVVEGIAASAASFIACGVDELVVAQNAELMIHKAWGMAVGNSDELAKYAADLDHEDRNIASIYAAKAGGAVDDWLDVMATDTWYSAEEAVTAGLADRVASPTGGGSAAARNRFDLSVFSARAKNTLPAADGISTTPPPAVEPETNQEGDVVSDALKTELAQRLGVTDADAMTDEQLLAALDETLAEQADGAADGAETPAPPAVPEGTVVVDQAAFDQLQADAAAGRAAKNELDQKRRADVVDAAIKAGKVLPARREHWLNQITADEDGITAYLASAPAVFPVTEAGHTGGVEEHNDNAEPLVAQAGWETPKESH